MGDKRRRARIQGGWASSASIAKKLPTIDKKTQQSYDFQPNIQIQKKPADIYISNDGEYEISSTLNGISRIKVYSGFIPNTECDWMFETLLNEIPFKEESISIKGKTVCQPRLTAWYGDMRYTYSGLTLYPHQFSPLLGVLKERIVSETSHHFNSMLANLYRNEKDSVDWHSDDEITLGPKPIIASISFGETRMFELRQKPKQGDDYSLSQNIRIPLPKGSLLLMDGATQIDWQHRIPKEYHDRLPRINLTFRQILASNN